MQLDYQIFQSINDLAGRSVFWDSTGIFFASYFQYVLAGSLFFLPFFAKNFKGQKEKIKLLFLAFFAALFARYAIASPLHHLFIRPRPFVDHVVNQLIPYDAAKSSFPSGHACFFFGLSTIIYFWNRPLGIIFYIFSFIISIARIYAGVHYLVDVLAGALIGIFSGWLVWQFKRYLKFAK